MADQQRQEKKSEIIAGLFKHRWNAATKKLSNPTVTLEDVGGAIRTYNQAHQSEKPLSDRNPANFFKDFVRNRARANANWPTAVLRAGFTARQVTGQNRCFEFVPLAAGQTAAFPLDVIPGPTAETPRHLIETASLPLASRRLGRSDEPWLIQVLVRQRVIETHLALVSKNKVVQLDHLQMSVKLAQSEIDALFLAVQELEGGGTREMIVSCEAKGRRDDILQDQVLRQVKAIFGIKKGIKQDVVLPMAVKALKPSEVYVVEFEPVTRQEASEKSFLQVSSTALYRLVPPVPGIGK